MNREILWFLSIQKKKRLIMEAIVFVFLFIILIKVLSSYKTMDATIPFWDLVALSHLCLSIIYLLFRHVYFLIKKEQVPNPTKPTVSLVEIIFCPPAFLFFNPDKKILMSTPLNGSLRNLHVFEMIEKRQINVFFDDKEAWVKRFFPLELVSPFQKNKFIAPIPVLGMIIAFLPVGLSFSGVLLTSGTPIAFWGLYLMFLFGVFFEVLFVNLYLCCFWFSQSINKRNLEKAFLLFAVYGRNFLVQDLPFRYTFFYQNLHTLIENTTLRFENPQSINIQYGEKPFIENRPIEFGKGVIKNSKRSRKRIILLSMILVEYAALIGLRLIGYFYFREFFSSFVNIGMGIAVIVAIVGVLLLFLDERKERKKE